MAIVAPTGYVLKVYKTEADAISDSNALKVDDSNGAIKNSNPQDSGYAYWTHEKYYYRIESNLPVTEFYIDWDDGEDNDPEGKANYTSIKFDTPSFVGITSHIYTGNSTTSGGYFPKIRAKSIEGYWSKFYQNALGAFSHTGIDVLTGETTMDAGRNSTYRIESDVTTERIPALYPEIKPPVCVLKSDKKRVFAGIDNDMLRDSNGDLKGSTLTLIEAFGDNGASNPVRTNVEVKVTYVTLGKKTDTSGDNTGTPHGFFGGIAQSTVSPGDIIRNVRQVLKVELLSLLEDTVAYNGTSPDNSKLFPGEKLALVASKATGILINNGSGEGTGDASLTVDTVDPRTVLCVGDTILTPYNSTPEDHIADNGKLMGTVSSFSSGTNITLAANNAVAVSDDDEIYIGYGQAVRQTVAEVSLGNPIVKIEDTKHTVTYDLTESFARTSEQSISNYYLDDGKDYLNYFATGETFQSTGASTAPTDKLQDTNGTMELSSGVAQKSYAFDLGYNFVDEDHRWLPKQVLSRGQIKVSNPLGSTNLYNMEFSPIEHWINDGHSANYSDTVDPGANSPQWTSDMRSSNLLAIKSTFDFDRWSDGETRNRTAGNNSNYILNSSGDSTEGADIYDFYDSGNNSLSDSENVAMMVCARDKKWTKQFFKIGANNISSTATVSSTTSDDQRNGKADKVIPGGYATNLDSQSGIGTSGVGKMNVRVDVMYTGLENNKDDSPMWKPLKIFNFTKHPDYDNSTWYVDGMFEWEEPEDWQKEDIGTMPNRFSPRGDTNSASGDTGAWAASTHRQAGTAFSTTVDDYFDNNADKLWDETNKKYGLMFLIRTDGGRLSETNAPKSYVNMNVQHTWPCSNSHSSVVTVIDPMHVSLNSFGVTQSISYTHKGKHQIVENRLGKADIRKIGSQGGVVSFGGIDLSSTTDREKFNRFQSQGTPVYLDADHEDGSKTRFFGVITNMSQDHPTGKLKPKFGLQMQVSHIITLNSSGAITSDGYISLGGQVDEPDYV